MLRLASMAMEPRPSDATAAEAGQVAIQPRPPAGKPRPLGVVAVNGSAGESAVAQKTAARKAAAEARATEEKLARIEEEHRQTMLKELADWRASNLSQKVSIDCTLILPHWHELRVLCGTVGSSLDLCYPGKAPPIKWWWTRGHRRV